MQQNDAVVSGWLNGSDLDNPAGPLYVERAVVHNMTKHTGPSVVQTLLKTTQSCASGCACC